MSVSARHRRLQPWQVLTACLLAVVLALGLAGGGVLGVWQGLSENATNMVTAAAASAVAVHSVHCSGLTPAYPTSCTDAQGTVTISWTAVPGSTGITVERATTPNGTYSTIATLAGTAITYTDSTAASNTPYYYEVYSGTPTWMPATDVDMALSLPPTGGIDDTIGTGGTAFTGANLTAMQTVGGTSYTTTTNWGAAATLAGGQEPDWMGCVSTSQCWLYTNQGDIWVTTNGGESWTQETTPSNPVWYGGQFANASDGWAVGANGTIVATTNGGTTWTAQTSGTTQELYGVSCVSTTQCWADGGNGVIVASTNGTSWTAQTSGTTNAFYAMDCFSATACWAGAANGTILASTNGTTWTAQTSGTTDYIWGLDCISASQCWANGSTTGGTAGVVLVTTNGGTTWLSPVSNQYVQWAFTPTVASGAPVTSAVLTLVDDASAAPAAGTETYVDVSANGGSNWTPLSIANPTTTLATQTLSIISVIGSGTAVSGLELRYIVTGSNAYKSIFDLVHVDIN